MAFWPLGGRSPRLPLPTKLRTEYIPSCSWFPPYFLFFSFPSIFLPLSQAGSQVVSLNEARREETREGGLLTPFPKVLEDLRAELEVGTKGNISALCPHTGPWLSPRLGESPRPLSARWAGASGLFPVHWQPMEFLSVELPRTWKTWLPHPKLTGGSFAAGSQFNNV